MKPLGFEGFSSGRRRVLVSALAICILPWSAVVAAPALPAQAATTTADLSLHVESDDDVVAVGDNFTLTMTLANDGPDEVVGVFVTGSLPVDWVFVSAVPAADYDVASGVWDVGPLTTGESRILQIVATMNGQGTLFYNAEVSASGADDPDSMPGNAPSGEDDEALVGVTGALDADLELDKAVDNANPIVGSNVTFTLTLDNDGPSDVSGVGVRDVLPSNMTFVSATPADYDSGTGIWNVPPVASGASASIDIVVSVTNDVASANCAEIWISPYIDSDSIRGNNSTNEDDDDCVAVAGQPRPNADLSLSAAGTPNVTIGGPASVQLIIRNDGPDSATDVVVRDNLASLPEFVFVSADSAESGTDYDSATGTWSVGTLASGASETLELFLTVTAAGEPQYQVEIIQSGAADPDSTPANFWTAEDDEAVLNFLARGTHTDLSLEMSVDNATPAVGSDVTFTLTVTNDGPYTVLGLSVYDLLPAGLTFVSADIPSNTSYDSTNGVWSAFGLDSGQSTGFIIVATVTSTSPVSNYAEIATADLLDPDSTPGNLSTTEDDDDAVIVTAQAVGADLSLTKTVDDPTPIVGTNVTFTLTVTNGGPDLATGVAVTDALPIGLTFVSADPSTAYDEASGVWTVGSVPSGASVDLAIVATVTGTAAVFNEGEVTAADQADPDSTPGNASTNEDDDASVTVTGQLVADLSLEMTVDDATPPIGTVVRFTLTVTNTGPHSASGVVVRDQLPSGFGIASSNTTHGTYVRSSGVWAVGSLAPSESAFLFIAVIAPEALVPTTNYAEVSASDQADPDSTPDNRSTTEDDDASVTVTPELGTADLSLTMSVSDPNPDVGQNVQVRVTVRNDGPDRATNVSVALVLPPGLTYFSDDSPDYDGLGQWTVGDLSASPAFRERTLTVVATVDRTSALVPHAEVQTSDQADPDSTPGNASTTEDDDASVTIAANSSSADLSLAMSVDDLTPNVGDNVTLTLSLVNGGPQAVNSANVEIQLPAGLTYVSDSGDGAFSRLGAGLGFWAVHDLPASTSAIHHITVRVIGAGSMVIDAEVSHSSHPDPDSTPNNDIPPEDDQASVTVTGQPIADLSLTMTADTDIPYVGSNVTYTLTLTNFGPSDVSLASVRDQLPFGMTFVSSNGDGTFGGGDWGISDLLAMSSVSRQIIARVDTTAPLVNRAEVALSSVPDPDSTPLNALTVHEDDDDSVTVTGQPFADLSLTKTVDDTMPTLGGRVTFTLTVSNASLHHAHGVVVTDLLPAGLVYVSDSDPINYNRTSGAWTVGTVPSGASRTLEIVATVTGMTPVANDAEVAAVIEFDPDSTPGDGSKTDDDDASVTVTGQPLVDLALAMTVSDTTPAIGVDFTIRLTLTNEDSTFAASGVMVGDALPAGLRFVSYTSSQGTFHPLAGVWEVGTMGGGSAATLTVTVKHRGGTLAPVTNYAQVFRADQDDPDSTLGDGSTTQDDDASLTLVPETPRCGGQAANRIGTIDDDTNATLPSTPGPDIVVLFAGDDVWDAGGGNDTVCAGDGNDVIRGDTGNDTLLGETGDDQLTAGAGMDTLRGGDGNDSLQGQDGNDTLTGEAGDDSLDGGLGNDTARGGIGNDSLLGDAGNDGLFGEAGNDGFSGGAGTDDCSGGAGTDFFIGGGTAGCERPAAIP